MFALRAWSVRHAKTLHGLYRFAARLAARARPLIARLPKGWTETLLRPVESVSKKLLFDCKMCGQCALSRTGMACPMNCPKQLRNGPCGGVRADGGCEVKPAMPCVWMEAGRGSALIGPLPDGNMRLLPVDRSREGASTWAQVLRDEVPPIIAAAPVPSQGSRGVASRLREACESGRTIVTVELGPPDAVSATAFIERARKFSGIADAINITDGAGANCHMSSVAAAALLVREGLPVVAQVTCRDRNRIAVQGDVLGAAALGVYNFLCLTGDDVSAGDQPEARRVFDLDAVNLVATLARMRDAGEFASGRKLEAPLDILIGATCNPFAPPFEDRVDNLERKIMAGAQFIQTQFCFDVPMAERFMDAVCRRGLNRHAAIIMGVGMLPSAKGLSFMARRIPGIHVPQALVDRIAAAGDQRAEGVAAIVEIVSRLRTIDGIRGFHLMGHRNEDMLLAIIDQSGIAQTAQSRKSEECA